MFGYQSHPKSGVPLTRRFASLGMETLEARETPAVITAPDTYNVVAGSVLTVNAIGGVLSNDFTDNNPNAILTATLTQPARSSIQPAPALPAVTLTFNSNGSFTFTAPSDYDSNKYGPVVFQYRANDTTLLQQSGNTTVTVNITSATNSTKLFATGSGPGVAGQVNVYEATSGLLRLTLFPYETAFTGGVRVATGDLNSDGVDDIITSPAEGGSARIVVFDGTNGVRIADFFAFNDPNFRGGAEIAIGDLDGNQTAGVVTNELIVGAGLGGGPRVSVFNVALTANKTLTTSTYADFFAYESTVRNGVRVAAGNINGLTGSSKRDFLVTGAGPGGGPAVKVYDGQRLQNTNDPPAVRAFFAFDSNARGGATVAIGQFRGDGRADIVVASGASDVYRIFDGRSTAQLRELIVPPGDGSLGSSSGSGGLSGTSSLNFGGGGGLITAVGSGGATGGIRIATTDRNGDGLSDVAVGAASGQVPRLRIFDGNSLSEITNFLPYPSSFLGGVFVGGNSL